MRSVCWCNSAEAFWGDGWIFLRFTTFADMYSNTRKQSTSDSGDALKAEVAPASVISDRPPKFTTAFALTFGFVDLIFANISSISMD